MMRLLKKTPLSEVHRELGARMMDFAGWELPVWYTSILEEHRTVRSGAGIFDVSDMGRVWITGRKAGDFLDGLFTRRPTRLKIGSAQLCLLCLEDGGILDDLLVYRVETDRFLVVWNAANIEQKLRAAGQRSRERKPDRSGRPISARVASAHEPECARDLLLK